VEDLIAFLNARLNEDEGGANWYAERMTHTLEPVLTWANVPLHTRMLREVEAKRRLVEVADTANLADDSAAWLGILKALAAVYSDHPDYRAEWRPLDAAEAAAPRPGAAA
jgi:hypothetical protein